MELPFIGHVFAITCLALSLMAAFVVVSNYGFLLDLTVRERGSTFDGSKLKISDVFGFVLLNLPCWAIVIMLLLVPVELYFNIRVYR